MNSELQETINKIMAFKGGLETELKDLEAKFKEYADKFNEDGTLSLKDKRNAKKVSARIKKVKSQLATIDELSKYESAKQDLNDFALKTLTKDEKKNKIKNLVELLKNANQKEFEKLAKELEIESENLDANKVKSDLETEISDLETTFNVLKSKNLDTSTIEDEIKCKKTKLEKIEKCLSEAIDEKTIADDLKKLSNSKTGKANKQAIIDKYTSIINKLEEEKAVELLEELEADKEKAMKKEETKGKLAQVGTWLKEHSKTIGCIAAGAIILTAIIVGSKGCEKTETNTPTKPEDTKNPGSNTSTNEGTENRETVNTLINMGFDEYTATRYAHINGFNLNYLGDYQDAIDKCDISIESAVDYVNRAYKIKETGFYDENIRIENIVEVVKAINEKKLNLAESVTLRQSINATLTDVYNNYQYETLSENDLNKINALIYFAADESDLDKFLTEYALLVKDVLNSDENLEISEKAKQEMYVYLNTFGNSFAGYLPEGEIENPNENAIVDDTFDWNMAYTSFIRPLMSMYVTEKNAEDFGCLQINMLSNYEQWAQLNDCDHTLTLSKSNE